MPSALVVVGDHEGWIGSPRKDSCMLVQSIMSIGNGRHLAPRHTPAPMGVDD